MKTVPYVAVLAVLIAGGLTAQGVSPQQPVPRLKLTAQPKVNVQAAHTWIWPSVRTDSEVRVTVCCAAQAAGCLGAVTLLEDKPGSPKGTKMLYGACCNEACTAVSIVHAGRINIAPQAGVITSITVERDGAQLPEGTNEP